MASRTQLFSQGINEIRNSPEFQALSEQERDEFQKLYREVYGKVAAGEGMVNVDADTGSVSAGPLARQIEAPKPIAPAEPENPDNAPVAKKLYQAATGQRDIWETAKALPGDVAGGAWTAAKEGVKSVGRTPWAIQSQLADIAALTPFMSDDTKAALHEMSTNSLDAGQKAIPSALPTPKADDFWNLASPAYLMSKAPEQILGSVAVSMIPGGAAGKIAGLAGAGTKAAQLAARIGSGIGSVGLETGSIQADEYRRSGNIAPLWDSLKYGLPAGIIDMPGESGLAAALARHGDGKLTKEAAKAFAKEAAQEAAGGIGSRMIKGAASEAGQEAVQSLLEESAKKQFERPEIGYLDSMAEAAKDPKSRYAIAEGAALGAIGGPAFAYSEHNRALADKTHFENLAGNVLSPEEARSKLAALLKKALKATDPGEIEKAWSDIERFKAETVIDKTNGLPNEDILPTQDDLDTKYLRGTYAAEKKIKTDARQKLVSALDALAQKKDGLELFNGKPAPAGATLAERLGFSPEAYPKEAQPQPTAKAPAPKPVATVAEPGAADFPLFSDEELAAQQAKPGIIQEAPRATGGVRIGTSQMGEPYRPLRATGSKAALPEVGLADRKAKQADAESAIRALKDGFEAPENFAARTAEENPELVRGVIHDYAEKLDIPSIAKARNTTPEIVTRLVSGLGIPAPESGAAFERWASENKKPEGTEKERVKQALTRLGQRNNDYAKESEEKARRAKKELELLEGDGVEVDADGRVIDERLLEISPLRAQAPVEPGKMQPAQQRAQAFAPVSAPPPIGFQQRQDAGQALPMGTGRQPMPVSMSQPAAEPMAAGDPGITAAPRDAAALPTPSIGAGHEAFSNKAPVAPQMPDPGLTRLMNAIESIAPAQQPAQTPAGARLGLTARAITPKNREIGVRYAVVEADDLITSDLPGYPPELQPRNRDKAASQAQIASIAARPIPERLITNHVDADVGTPIVGSDMLVESGNGRAMGIRQAYRSGTGEAYKSYLASNAAAFGINPAEVLAAKSPVLVRIRQGEMPIESRRELAKELNLDTKLQMSASEQAISDADAVTSLISRLSVSESGDIFTSGNLPFLRGFFSKVATVGDEGRFMDDNGRITQDGADRVMRAVFSAAYGNPRLVSLYSDSTDVNVRTVMNALVRAIPQQIVVRDGVKKGTLHPLDITEQIAEAAVKLNDLRSSGESVTDYMAQGLLLGDPMPPLSKDMLIIFDAMKSAPKIAAVIDNHNRAVLKLGNPKQGQFEKTEIPAKADIVLGAVRTVEEKENVQPDLFADKREDGPKGDGPLARRLIAQREKDALTPLGAPDRPALGDRRPGAEAQGPERPVTAAAPAASPAKDPVERIADALEKLVPTAAAPAQSQEPQGKYEAVRQSGAWVIRKPDGKVLPGYMTTNEQSAKAKAALMNLGSETKAEEAKTEDKKPEEKKQEKPGVIKGRAHEAALKEQPQSFPGNPAPEVISSLKLATDSIASLRKPDVARVLDEAQQQDVLDAAADYIREHRPDLAEDINAIQGELNAEGETAEQKLSDGGNNSSDTYSGIEENNNAESSERSDQEPREAGKTNNDGEPARIRETGTSSLETVSSENVSGTGEVGETPRNGSVGGRRNGTGNVSSPEVSEDERGGSLGGDKGRVDLPAADNGRVKPERGGNFRLVEDEYLEGKITPKQRFRANVEAIKTVRMLDKEGRKATAEEQKIISRFTGWGAIPQVFVDAWQYQSYREYAESDPKRAERYLEDYGAAQFKEERKELAQLLDEEEYEAARRSTINAHYTSPAIIRAMWKMMESMGFKGGRVLEPATGNGMFLSLSPENIANNTVFTGVELDEATAKIAQYLFQDSKIYNKGFQDVGFPKNFFDLSISNVPFANINIFDKKKPYSGFLLHDYFFAKTLEITRPGGVVAFITSKGTMDKKGTQCRKYLSEDHGDTPGADLVAAFRLPSTAFKGIANTEVVTDIIILQKRQKVGETPKGNWIEVSSIPDPAGKTPIPINQYYVDHPEHLLGKMNREGSMYAGGEVSMSPIEGMDLAAKLEELAASLPEDAFKKVAPEVIAEGEKVSEIYLADGLPPGAFTVKDGKLKRSENKQLTDVSDLSTSERNMVMDYLSVKDAAEKMVAMMRKPDVSDDDIKAAQAEANKAYDLFVKRHGNINDSKNAKILKDDPLSGIARALEIVEHEPDLEKMKKQTGKAKDNIILKPVVKGKAPILSKRTIMSQADVTKADNPIDAIFVTLAQHGRLDIENIAKLLGKDIEETKSELLEAGLVFENPTTGTMEIAEEYLSGNVRAKYETARQAAELDPKYAKNAAALQAVIPDDIPVEDIAATLGGSWLPADIVKAFVADAFGAEDINDMLGLKYVPESASWAVDLRRINFVPPKLIEYNVPNTGYSGWDLLTDTLNLKVPNISIYTGSGIERVKDPVASSEATLAAIEKQQQLAREFETWVKNTAKYHEAIVRAYNDTFNNYVRREYDGKYLSLPGMDKSAIGGSGELRPYQKDAVWRILFGGNVGLGHAVGAGKTFTMISAAMELRRLGIRRKPAVVVPNHLTGQWATDFRRLYPGARILSPTDSDFEAANRRRLIAQIATGDWDAVIIPMSQFKLLNVSKEVEQAFYQKQIDQIMRALIATRGEEGLDEEGNPKSTGRWKPRRRGSGSSKKKSPTIKSLEKMKERIEQKMQKLLSMTRDPGMTFESTGIDYLFVDEAHAYKNLFYATKMNNVRGLGDPDGSEQSADILMKLEYLRSISGKRGVATFATGTPISNSLTEIHAMMRYLSPDILKEMGIEEFDSWASAFTTQLVSTERTVAGVFRRVTRLGFRNIPEVVRAFRTVWDIKTQKDINLPRPKLAGDESQLLLLEPSEQQVDFMASLKERDKWIRDNPDPVSRKIDNMLKLATDAALGTLDLRIVDPAATADEGGKIASAAKKIAEIYHKHADKKFAQLVFLDRQSPKTGKKASGRTDFDAYQELKDRLIKAGVSKSDIVFIHDLKSAAAKIETFKKINSGDIRILIGTTEKMGAGTNVQKKLCAIHRLVPPWRPSDVEQGDGRILRPGNTVWDEHKIPVEIINYSVSDSFDAFVWQMLARKAQMISSIMSGSDSIRSVDDLDDDQTRQFANFMAASTGDPRVKEMADLENELAKLRARKRSHDAKVNIARRETSEYGQVKREIAKAKKEIEVSKAAKTLEFTDAPLPVKSSDDEIMAIVKGAKNQSEIGNGLRELLLSKPVGYERTITIGESVAKIKHWEGKGEKHVTDATVTFNDKDIGTATVGDRLLVSVKTALKELKDNADKTIDNATKAIEAAKKELENYAKVAKEKFPDAERMTEAQRRYDELMAQFNAEAVAATAAAESEDEDSPKKKNLDVEGDADEVLYSKGNPDIRYRRASEASDNEPFNTRDAVLRLAADLNANLGGTALKIEVARAPEGAPADASGQYDGKNKIVTVFEDRIKSADHLAAVLAHEIVGHGKFLREFGKHLEEIGTLIEREAPDVAQGVQRDYRGEPRPVMLAEMVGRMAEKDHGSPSLWDRIVIAFNRAMRALGFKRDFTLAEVKWMLADMRREAFGTPSMADLAAKLKGKPAKIEAPRRAGSFREALENLVPAKKESGARFITTPEEVMYSMDEDGAPDDDGPGGGKADQTNTPEFKRWFGGSKVVDKNGEPKVVYHWTDEKDQFTSFKPNNGVIWFSENKKVFDTGNNTFGSPRVIPAYLRIENPLNLSDANSEYSIAEWRQILSEFGIGNSDEIEFDSGLSEEEIYSFGYLFPNTDNDLNGDSNMVEIIKSNGFDGILAPPEGYMTGEKNWIAFNPTQVKSAIGNTGAFDPNNPDIRYSRGGQKETSPAEEAVLRTQLEGRTKDRAFGETKDDPYKPGMVQQIINALDATLFKTGSEMSREKKVFQKAIELNPSEARSIEELERQREELIRVGEAEALDDELAKHVRDDNFAMHRVARGILSALGESVSEEFRDWTMRKVRRVLMPFLLHDKYERLMSRVGERMYWNGQEMVPVPGIRTRQEDGTYRYEWDEITPEMAMNAFNRMPALYQELLTERAKKNEEYRKRYVKYSVPAKIAESSVALMGWRADIGSPISEHEKDRFEAAMKHLESLSPEELARTKLTGEKLAAWRQMAAASMAATKPRTLDNVKINETKGLINKAADTLAALETDRGIYGYVHHTGFEGTRVNAGRVLGTPNEYAHPWFEAVAPSRRQRAQAQGYIANLFISDVARRKGELRADADNAWMEKIESLGIPLEYTEDVTNEAGETVEAAREIQTQEELDERSGAPGEYSVKNLVRARFGPFAGKEIFLPSEAYDRYRAILEPRSNDYQIKDLATLGEYFDSWISSINRALLFYPSKMARDLASAPFHVADFLFHYSLSNPADAAHLPGIVWEASKNLFKPETWTRLNRQKMGEYSEAQDFLNEDGWRTPLTFGLDKAGESFGNYPIGSVLAAMANEADLASMGDIPVKRFFLQVGEQLAEKKGLTGLDRERFIRKLTGEYGFETSDQTPVLNWARGKYPTEASRVVGKLQRGTIPFMGYISSLFRRLVLDPVNKGILGRGESLAGWDETSTLSRVAYAARPVFWMAVAYAISKGALGNYDEDEAVAGALAGLENLATDARTTGRILWSKDKNPDGSELYVSVKGFAHPAMMKTWLEVLRGNAGIGDVWTELATVAPVADVVMAALGHPGVYRSREKRSSTMGRIAAMLALPQFSRVGPDLSKLWRYAIKDDPTIPDTDKATFLEAFGHQLGISQIPGKSSPSGEPRKMQGVLEALKAISPFNIKEVPYSTSSAEANKEAKRMITAEQDLAKLKKWQANNAARLKKGQAGPMEEAQVLSSLGYKRFRDVPEAIEYLEREILNSRKEGLIRAVQNLPKGTKTVDPLLRKYMK